MMKVRAASLLMTAVLVLHLSGCTMSGGRISVDKVTDMAAAAEYEKYGSTEEFLGDTDNARVLEAGMYVRTVDGIRDIFRDDNLNALYDGVDGEFISALKPSDADEAVIAAKSVKDGDAYSNVLFFCCKFGNNDDTDRYFKSVQTKISDILSYDKNKKTDVDDEDESYVNIIATWRKYALCMSFVRDGRSVYVCAALGYKTNGMRDIVYAGCDALGIRRPSLDDVDCTKASAAKGDRMLTIKEELGCREIDMSEVANGNMYRDEYKGQVLYYQTSTLEELEYIGYSADNKFEADFVQGEAIYGRTKRKIQQGVGSYRVIAITLDSEEAAADLYGAMIITGFDDYDKDEGEKDGIRYCKYTSQHEQVVMSFYFYQEGARIYQLFAWESLEDSYEDVITRNIEIMGLP